MLGRIGKKIIKTVPARQLWDKIASAAWACADPGLQFDTTIEESAKQFGTYNPNKAAQNGYAPYPAAIGNLQFIPGFVEGINLLNFGGKAKLYIPSNLAYGPQGAGGIIPPNANIYFEIELLENPTK